MEGFGGGHGMPDEDEWVAAVENRLAATPTHPFTPDVVEWARWWDQGYIKCYPADDDNIALKAARQILAAVGRG